MRIFWMGLTSPVGVLASIYTNLPLMHAIMSGYPGLENYPYCTLSQ